MTAELRPDEQLLWTGGPDPARRFSHHDAYLIPVTVLWLGFMITWTIGVNVTPAPVPLRVLGPVMLVLGGVPLLGRFWWKQRLKRGVQYALTDRRAIMMTRRAVREVPLGGHPVRRRMSRDGTHLTVEFGDRTFRRRGTIAAPPNSGLEWDHGAHGPVAFYDVADMTGLESALQRAGR
ncbi:hypothetical protein GIS00_06265 [Nakamurella sp. YIM 132087]|uniref:PH domain-containing protein n=1 Tax=Nakamurella alba TaxID=2665158 RepID=A0A7K1FHH2_9ACTN|nr:hypothetical protein [Nakamurella alba]MTD13548.1 hypothetical protein [Nakamurella alba]